MSHRRRTAGALAISAVLASMPFAVFGQRPPAAPGDEVATKYDVVGVRLGMPIKDALAVLKVHNGAFQVKPDMYDELPPPLTYGVALTAPTEKVYMLLTMPPNQAVVSTIGRFVNFTKENAPTQEVLVEELTTKYGAISSDSGPESLQGAEFEFVDRPRRILFVDDRNGQRLNRAELPANKIRQGRSNDCDNHRAFSLVPYMESLGARPFGIDPRIEKGVEDAYRTWPASCWDFTYIQVELYSTQSQIRLLPSLPATDPWNYKKLSDIVGSMMIIVGSGPIDRAATEATRTYFLQATKARDDKIRQDAGQNRPKL